MVTSESTFTKWIGVCNLDKQRKESENNSGQKEDYI